MQEIIDSIQEFVKKIEFHEEEHIRLAQKYAKDEEYMKAANNRSRANALQWVLGVLENYMPV